MPRKKRIVRVREEGGEWTGLAYADTWHTIIGDGKDASAAELAQLCADEAENANYHDFVPVCHWLARTLVKECGEEKAAAIMRRITECGGLHSCKE